MEAGAGPWAICDRCGLKRRHATLRTEWTNAFVCQTCFDPRPPYLDPPVIDPMEGAPIPNARMRATDVFIDEENPVSGDDYR